ncbi:hypothetical protein [Wenjunlia vitaminophila]|uniref:hypothetical protein n=1 Tax=Wenjunlia vitaminophila TaxID=76728 RepID=UPI00037AC685|nr:hypothetical protein [Wenjunlia vitaminophila]
MTGPVMTTEHERMAAARSVGAPPAQRPPRIDPPQQWAPGQCHLYCQRTDVPVAWLAPVKIDGEHAGMYACAKCRQALARLLGIRPASQPPPPGRHRRPGP